MEYLPGVARLGLSMLEFVLLLAVSLQFTLLVTVLIYWGRDRRELGEMYLRQQRIAQSASARSGRYARRLSQARLLLAYAAECATLRDRKTGRLSTAATRRFREDVLRWQESRLIDGE